MRTAAASAVRTWLAVAAALIYGGGLLLVGLWAGDRAARLELRPDFETVTQERIWKNGKRCVLWRITDLYGTHYVAVGDCRIATRVDR